MARIDKSVPLKEVLQQIQSGRVQSLYLLHGDEMFLADQVIDALARKVFGAPKDDFNLHVFHGKESDMTVVLNTAMSFPMMADRKVVIVRDIELYNKADRDALTAYVANPMESTSLVCVSSKADFRQNPFKALGERAVCVELKEVSDREAPAWIESFVERRGKRIGSEAALLLAARVDVSLRELDSEVGKLATYVGSRDTITEEDVETVIGVSRQYNIFEMTDAVGQKDLARAVRVFDQMFRYGEEPVGIVVMLCRHFVILSIICDFLERRRPTGEIEAYFTSRNQLKPYLVTGVYLPQAGKYSPAEIDRVFGALLEADADLKSSPVAKDVIMHRLLVRIIRGVHP